MIPPILPAAKYSGTSLAFNPHSLDVVSSLHFNPHHFAWADKHWHLNAKAVLQLGLFPGRFLLCVRRGCCFGNTDFGHLGEDHTERLAL